MHITATRSLSSRSTVPLSQVGEAKAYRNAGIHIPATRSLSARNAVQRPPRPDCSEALGKCREFILPQPGHRKYETHYLTLQYGHFDTSLLRCTAQFLLSDRPNTLILPTLRPLRYVTAPLRSSYSVTGHTT